MQKKLVKAIKKDKENALRKIEDSIDKWQKFSEKNKLFRNYNNFKNNHWNNFNRFSSLFNIHLSWSDKIIKSINNVEEFNVLDALNGLKKFYLNISTIKPNLSHPEILKCYNLTAIKNNFKVKEIYFKENIDVEILDPFGNVTGKDNHEINESLSEFQEIAINEIKKEIKTIEEFERSNNKRKSYYEKKSNNIIMKKNKKVDLEFYINGKKIKVLEDIKFRNLKNDLLILMKVIKSINTEKPNLKNNLIRKIYIQIVKNKNSNKSIFSRIVLPKTVSKIVNKIKRNVPI